MMPSEKARDSGEKGIALIMVLWVLTVLMVIVLSFSYTAKTEMQAALAFKQGIEKKYLAEAGIERGIIEIVYEKQNRNAQVVLEGGETWRMDGTPHTVQTEDGYYTVSITDESGKININTLDDTSGIILKNLIMNSGAQEKVPGSGAQEKAPDSGLQEKVVDTIVDSILDWKDGDDLTRLNGAESDYYMSLPNPYKARDDNFQTLEELLLVKGMTPEMLYGGNKKKGIINFLTVVNSGVSTINANAAPKEVLMAVPGITAEIAEAIVSSRENPADPAATASIQGMLAAIQPPFNKLLSFGAAGGVFTIESSAYKGDSKGAYTIKATILIEGNNKFKYVYYKSPDSTRVPSKQPE